MKVKKLNENFELIEEAHEAGFATSKPVNEDKEIVAKFAKLVADKSKKAKGIPKNLESADADQCSNCGGDLLPIDADGVRKCQSCGNQYVAEQSIFCPQCGGDVDTKRDCKCKFCGYEFLKDSQCPKCGGEVRDGKCKHCGSQVVTEEVAAVEAPEADKEKKDDEQAVRDYREFANIDEAFEITEENIDAWALNEAAVKNNIQSYDLKHVLLKEEKTIDQAGRELEAEVARVESQNQVDRVLDRSLKIAKRKQRSGDTGDFPNILLVSDAGFGKTDMVRQWAQKNGVNLVQKNLGTMGPEAFGGIVARDADDPRYATRLGTNEMIKALEKPNSVLFLDEYNRSKTEVRGAVLTLVQNHMVWDPTEENQEKFLDNFLFTVAAINPPNAAYKGAKEMDPAELSRFYTVNMQPDPMEHLRYLRSFYTAKIEGAEDDDEKLEYRRKLALAEKILNSPRFTYDGAIDIEENQDNPSYKPLNYRSFKMALDYSDGTKDDFLDVWNHYCNPKKKRTIEDILGDYVDIDDKANDALKDDSESDVFSKEMSARAKLKAAFSELNI